MSVASKNPFELLDDERSSSPAPKAAPAAAAGAKATPAADKPKAVPGAASKGAARGARYPSRGAPRNVYRGEERPATEGGDDGFEGERVGEYDCFFTPLEYPPNTQLPRRRTTRARTATPRAPVRTATSLVLAGRLLVPLALVDPRAVPGEARPAVPPRVVTRRLPLPRAGTTTRATPR